jgi:hypothetical protein
MKLGKLVYFDSVTGMIPCKLINIKAITSDQKPIDETKVANSGVQCTVKITSHANKAFKYGEIIETLSLHVVPRNKYSHRNNRIKTYTIGDLSL